MLKYHRCLKNDTCKLQSDCPMTGKKNGKCNLTNGTCKYQGCMMIMPTKENENDGRLIIGAIEGKF